MQDYGTYHSNWLRDRSLEVKEQEGGIHFHLPNSNRTGIQIERADAVELAKAILRDLEPDALRPEPPKPKFAVGTFVRRSAEYVGDRRLERGTLEGTIMRVTGFRTEPSRHHKSGFMPYLEFEDDQGGRASINQDLVEAVSVEVKEVWHVTSD